MERAIFLVEDGDSGSALGDRIECMVNPSEVVLRRLAGIVAQRSLAGAFRGAGLADDPLLSVGGGTSELELDLLFDVTMSGLTQPLGDVRRITERFWRTTEPGASEPSRLLLRFIWGRAWNFLGTVAALSERLEHFDESGAPRRSWLRMRLLRVPDRAEPALLPGIDGTETRSDDWDPSLLMADTSSDVEVHTVLGSVSSHDDDAHEPAPSSWLTELAEQTLGSAAKWRMIAAANDLEDPLRPSPSSQVKVPTQQRGAP